MIPTDLRDSLGLWMQGWHPQNIEKMQSVGSGSGSGRMANRMIRAWEWTPISWDSYAWEWEVEYQWVLTHVGMREAGYRRGPGCGEQMAERVTATLRVHCLASEETHLGLLGNARGG